MTPAPKITLIVPVYNEQDSIAEMLRRLKQVMQEVGSTFEIVFIDDGCTDGSAALLDEIFEQDPAVQVIHLRRNFGKAAALAAGFKEARGEILVTIDGDLQDTPEEIPLLLQKISEGYDLVSGWKFPRRDPLRRRLASKLFNIVVRMMTGISLHDMNSGFKAYRREVTDQLNLYGELHRYIPVIAHSYGFRITEVKTTHAPRRFGSSKYGLWRFFSGFFDLFTVLMLTRFGARPLHIFGMIGFITTLIGLVTTLYLVLMRLFGNYLSNRPLFYFSLSTLIVGVQVVFFGLLAEMLAHSRGAETFYSIRSTKTHHPRPTADTQS